MTAALPLEERIARRRKQWLKWLHDPAHPDRLEKRRAEERKAYFAKKRRAENNEDERLLSADGRPRIGRLSSECFALAMSGQLYG